MASMTGRAGGSPSSCCLDSCCNNQKEGRTDEDLDQTRHTGLENHAVAGKLPAGRDEWQRGAARGAAVLSAARIIPTQANMAAHRIFNFSVRTTGSLPTGFQGNIKRRKTGLPLSIYPGGAVR